MPAALCCPSRPRDHTPRQVLGSWSKILCVLSAKDSLGDAVGKPEIRELRDILKFCGNIQAACVS